MYDKLYKLGLLIGDATKKFEAGEYETDSDGDTFIPIQIPHGSKDYFMKVFKFNPGPFNRIVIGGLNPLFFKIDVMLYFKIPHVVHLKSLTEWNLHQLMNSPKWDDYEAGPITFITTPKASRFFVTLTRRCNDYIK